MDLVLLPLLQATEESEREQRLSHLILVHAAPVIRHALRQRLGFYVNGRGVNPHNPDAEDLYNEVIAKLIQLLNDPQLLSRQYEVRSFQQYVARVATNACYDYLRVRSPARSRLKNNLRDLLDRHRDFAIWKSENDTLCGFVAWRDDNKQISPQKHLSESEETPEAFRSRKFPHEDIGKAPLSTVVAEIFNWLNGPVELGELVKLIAVLLNIKDHAIASLSEEHSYRYEHLADVTHRCESRVEAREVLGRLWEEIIRLPNCPPRNPPAVAAPIPRKKNLVALPMKLSRSPRDKKKRSAA